MNNMGLEKAKEPEIKLPASAGSWIKEQNTVLLCKSSALEFAWPSKCGSWLLFNLTKT